MQTQKVQSCQTTFGTKVIFTKDLNKMLKKRGYGYSLPFKDCIYHIENNNQNDTMTVSLNIAANRRHYVVGMRSVTDETGRIFASKSCVKRPFLHKNHVASLSEMYYELKQTPMKEVKM